ncbi:NUDIX domain-containing protein [Streptomyces sp. XY431]|uniref:NUDIX domain-containing protein n=1 Tax=Streptomyces sp. XY431 TaxID=1415562 RepID=UPI0006B0553B|nr:NUDIX domain-containing protein [Streptomyces sp. XY431]
MPPSADAIAAVTRAYLDRHPAERAKLEPLLAVLATEPQPTSRTTLPAHVTCSAIVINRDRQVLHIHHRATGLTLCPGGHGEEADTSLLATALREVAEEAGIPPGALCLVPELLDRPVDIDVNDIDPNPERGGVQLSGGQWQKVALARTRLRLTTPDQDNRLPALVVVDEPTSALDPQAEVAAFEQIRHLTDLGVTVVLITHRLGATAKADHIFVLDHGRLVEEGSHSDLMARQPATHYREAYLLQARQYDTTVPGQTRGRDGADTH